MWEKYYSVSSLHEALLLLSKHNETARVIAGGTDILIEIEQGKRPDVRVLIDITRVPQLDTIRLHGDRIHLGPLVNHNHIVASELIRQRALPLAQASWEVGAPQIRNRATVAGNLITASPANDTIAPLLALDADVTLSSVRGERTLPLRNFYNGLRQSIMHPDELLTDISFSAMTLDERGVFLKLGLRRAQAISVVNIAAVVRFDGDQVRRAAVAVGSVAPTVIRLQEVEQMLVGQQLTEDVIDSASQLAASLPRPIDDVRSTASYRAEMIRVLMRRALHMLAEVMQQQTLPTTPAMLWGPHQARVTGNALPQTITHQANTPIEATINGKHRVVTTGQDKTLLRWLREDAELPGTKEGCAEGECGACTVFLDGVAVMACMVPAPRAHGAEIVTVEGLAGPDGLHSIQQAFIDQAAVQCGYCTPGFLMAGAKLLEEVPEPTEAQIQQSISGNLCRCTGYYAIIEAFKEASQMQRSNEDGTA